MLIKIGNKKGNENNISTENLNNYSPTNNLLFVIVC